MSRHEEKIHDCHDAEARIEMLDGLYLQAEAACDEASEKIEQLSLELGQARLNNARLAIARDAALAQLAMLKSIMQRETDAPTQQ